jgi:hypothetical protein
VPVTQHWEFWLIVIASQTTRHSIELSAASISLAGWEASAWKWQGTGSMARDRVNGKQQLFFYT